MSAFPQFTNSLEQPSGTPPSTPPAIPAGLSGQPAERPRPSAHSTPFRVFQTGVATQQVSPAFAFREFDVAIISEVRAMPSSLDDQFRLLEHPAPPRGAGEFQFRQWEGRHLTVRRDLALTELERVYVFENRAEVSEFIERNRIRGLLLEAAEPLNAAFGEKAVKKLTVLDDDEGFTTLFCLILFPGDIAVARLALEFFDQHWWLPRSRQASGKLNFDFELI